MDSLSLYRSFCEYGKAKSDRTKYKQVDQMIACIYSEIFTPPFETSRSPFFCEIMSVLGRRTEWSRGGQTGGLSMLDVYVILNGLCEYINDQSYQTTAIRSRLSEYLLCSRALAGSQKWENRIIEYVKEIGRQAGEAKTAYERENSKVSPIEPKAESQTEPKAAPQTEPKAAPRTEEKRAESNQNSIRKWHEEQEEMNQSLRMMQPKVRELLEGFLSLSDRITENYVLQFARQQVELYNLIADAYEYHKSRAEESEHEDYRNAVQNYEEYLYAIEDALAAFGVEAVISSPGTRFEGGIHEADDGHFSAKNAVVARSIRPGFRYKEIVIQREKVKLG